MKTLSDIQTTLKTQTPVLCRDYPIRRLGIFGSVASGDATSTSDIDLLVEFTSPVSLFRFIALEQQLSKLLKSPVDLVTPQALKSAVKEEILRSAIYVTE